MKFEAAHTLGDKVTLSAIGRVVKPIFVSGQWPNRT